MIIDRYTKMVLTVIAVSLVFIASSSVNEIIIESALASSGCGDYFDPCHVKVVGSARVQ